jgi:SpoVK/Ycf46/Vps4 family AAA+-type ATPase
MGKTYLASCIAGQTKLPFIATSAQELLSPFSNQSAINVSKIFAQARQAALNHEKRIAILFIDEIDTLLQSRDQTTDAYNTVVVQDNNRVVSAFLTELDGVKNEKDCSVIVIGATNLPNGLDSAFLRSGRCDMHIHIDFPTYDDLCSIFSYYLQKTLFNQINGDRSAQAINILFLDNNITPKQLYGLTPADVKSIVNNIERDAFIAQHTKDKNFTWQHAFIKNVRQACSAL